MLMRADPRLNIHVGVELEVASLVADSKVAVGHLGFSGLDCHLVASQPALIPCYRCSMDSGTSKI